MILNINEAIIACNKLKEIDLDIGNEYLRKIKEVKQPLKQAVHCTTQEEWDFVTEKLGHRWVYTSSWGQYGDTTCINLCETKYAPITWCEQRNYQILSFQEWCDLNDYKMETKYQFEVGKYYSFDWYYGDIKNPKVVCKVKSVNYNSCMVSWRKYLWDNSESTFDGYDFKDIHNIKELSIEEIQQYLPDGHPDKIQVKPEFKIGDYVCKECSNGNIIYQVKTITPDGWLHGYIDGGGWSKKILRHATPEEIKQHLISMGQIATPDECIKPIVSYIPCDEVTSTKSKTCESFKVGDYVYHKYNNECYKITQITDGDLFKAESGSYCNGGKLSLKYCRAATRDEIQEYNKKLNLRERVEKGEVTTYNGIGGIHHIAENIGDYSLYSLYSDTDTNVLYPQRYFIGIDPCENVKLKTILSINDEELPMVNIIKTKTINLLNNN